MREENFHEKCKNNNVRVRDNFKIHLVKANGVKLQDVNVQNLLLKFKRTSRSVEFLSMIIKINLLQEIDKLVN